jgi:hypothetical protein
MAKLCRVKHSIGHVRQIISSQNGYFTVAFWPDKRAYGVTLDHLKGQVFERLGKVQKFNDNARVEELDFGEPSSDSPSSMMMH